MPSRIEVLAQAAEDMPQPLSAGRLTYFADDAAHLIDHISVDHENIVDYMEDYDLPKPSLAHMLISIHKNRTIGSDSDAQACVFNTPRVLHGQVYYPHIALGCNIKNPDVRDLNNSLRHELWHLVQESVESAYNRPHVVKTMRNLGFAAIGGATALAGLGDHTPAVYSMTVAAAVTGAIVAVRPDSLLQFFSQQEMEAKHFAREHQDFQPISLLS